MENLLRELYANGFIVRPEGQRWIAEKIDPAIAESGKTVEEPIISDTFEGAVKLAYAVLQESRGVPTIREFTAVVRYNRGLGIEYKNLAIVQAANYDEAKSIAARNAEIVVGGPGVDIREVRVTPKG